MLTKHFFKVLGIFIFMILLGIAGLFAIDYFSGKTEEVTETNITPKVADPIAKPAVKSPIKSDSRLQK